MKQHLNEFFERYSFPSEAAQTLLSAYDVLSQNVDFCALYDTFYTDDTLTAESVEEKLIAIAEQVGVHEYTTKYLFYLCLTKVLIPRYRDQGIDEQVIFDTFEDFKYKLDECLNSYDVVGYKETLWYFNFMRGLIFKIGRLEYEIMEYHFQEATVGGVELKAGDTVLNVHIPSSGESFDKAARFDSYSKAYHFFKNVVPIDAKMYVCSSWLLFPDNTKILSPKSNIVSFMDDFKIFYSYNYQNAYHVLRFIFGADTDKPYEELPRDSSLRRAYVDWLLAGNPVGFGRGAFVWDEENKTVIK